MYVMCGHLDELQKAEKCNILRSFVLKMVILYPSAPSNWLHDCWLKLYIV